MSHQFSTTTQPWSPRYDLGLGNTTSSAFSSFGGFGSTLDYVTPEVGERPAPSLLPQQFYDQCNVLDVKVRAQALTQAPTLTSPQPLPATTSQHAATAPPALPACSQAPRPPFPPPQLPSAVLPELTNSFSAFDYTRIHDSFPPQVEPMNHTYPGVYDWDRSRAQVPISPYAPLVEGMASRTQGSLFGQPLSGSCTDVTGNSFGLPHFNTDSILKDVSRPEMQYPFGKLKRIIFMHKQR